MFGVSAKERLAQLQQKAAKDAPVGKLSAGLLKTTPGKLSSAPGQLKKPEPPKPAADVKKPVAPQPAKPKEEPKKPEAVKPKEEPKTTAVQEPAKPKEEPKAPAAPEPAKPKEEPKKPVAPEPAKPKEEPQKPAAPEPVKPKEEPQKPAAPEPAKPKEEPQKPAAPEPAKPKEEPKKPAAPEPSKPAEEPKKTAAPEPAKPTVEPKKPAAPEPAKPKEEPKKPAAPEPAKPKEEPKKPAAPEPAKPKEEPKKPAAPEPAKPKEEPKKPAAPEPAKPKEEPKKPAAPEPAKAANLPSDAAAVKPAVEPAAAKPVEEVKKPSDDFFHSIFYFSGMGTLVGSALAEGVYVPEKTQRNALDSDDIEAARERQKLRRGEEIIATARNQAQGLSTDFRHLQALLESLPTFTEVLEPQPLDRRAVDQVIHGHVYFQQEQHPAPTHSRPVHHQPPSSATAEIASHVPQQQRQQQQQQQHPTHVAGAEPRRAPPVGGVAVLPDLFDQQRHRGQRGAAAPEAASFAAAIDEFDRATSAASHQQPLFAALPPRPPSEPTRPHSRGRPTTGDEEEHGGGGGSGGEGHGGGSRPFGVYTGQAAAGPSAGSAQPWQERYGQTEVTKFAAPRPFSATGGDIDSKGIKSWQMSHLRTLEVKGYHIVSDTEPDAIKSYSPYLVSDRSHGADRQQQHRGGSSGPSPHPTGPSPHPTGPSPHPTGGPSPHPTGGVEPPVVSASTYKPPDAINSPFAQALEESLGYSDL